MGGLLAAEAATNASYKARSQSVPDLPRIVAMVAFDTPYLGMHPHVVKSGIASLFAKKDKEETSKVTGQAITARQVNALDHVAMVDEKVTDDWENCKKDLAGMSVTHVPFPPLRKTPAQNKHRTSLSSMSFDFFSMRPISRSRSPSPLLRTQSPLPLPSHSPVPPSLIEKALSYLQIAPDDPFVRWVRKHSDDPFNAGARWILEHFQFGLCMFDPIGLRERYKALVEWDGMWVNYWTESGVVNSSAGAGKEQRADNDAALVESGIVRPSTPSSLSSTHPDVTVVASSVTAATATSTAEVMSSISEKLPSFGRLTKSKIKESQGPVQKESKASAKKDNDASKVAEKEDKAVEKQPRANVKLHGHHFVVLPTGLGQVLGGLQYWEKLQIAGVQDEVAAHMGLFIRSQNLDYEGSVERVGKRILSWCERL
jgi:hypothetical protein